MARINDHILVQRIERGPDVEDHIVFMDESTGAEIVFPITLVPIVVRALAHLNMGA
jgi:hypothetical protein